ncbi:TAXI family TRAP transporter solute-binding subunit [Virgibacillus xinjiangensis]|uniref:TAXI family TRAP transporter solute-binding subunit n=1 Tax=Virgibacillus xinjiangensis TaxID=393090 RepID=A0ABV7CZC0_9BACI
MRMIKSFAMVLFVFVLAACSQSAGNANQFLTLATAPSGGTYYPIGVGLGNFWTEHFEEEGISVTGQSSAGSVENIDLMRDEEADLAIVQGLMADRAYNGVANFEGNAYEDLRTISMLWPNVEHFVLMNDAIESGTISDIEGSSFSIGAQASGTEVSTLAIMEGVGLSRDDVDPEHLGHDDIISAMRDGRLDGGSLPGGTPVAAITDMYASGVDASLLEVTPEQLEAINEVASAWFEFNIPAGTYPNTDEDITTIAQPNLLAVRADLDEDVVYQLTKSMYENLNEVHAIHASAENIELESALDGLPAPLHPGALKFYEEQGIDIPDHLYEED